MPSVSLLSALSTAVCTAGVLVEVIGMLEITTSVSGKGSDFKSYDVCSHVEFCEFVFSRLN